MQISKDKSAPIGVFDSGVGGISVLRELIKIMPYEDYLYFGDSANAPYGGKNIKEVEKLTINAAEMFIKEGVKGMVVACNTATSAAVADMRMMYPDLPLVGIEPALKPAVFENLDNPTILVMATHNTIKEQKFQKLVEKYASEADVIPVECPGLMEFVERGETQGERLRVFLQNLLLPAMENMPSAIVLGCTHYPFVADTIREIVGPWVKIYDGGEGTAREMRRRLEAENLLNSSNKKGKVKFLNSLASKEILALSKTLLES